MSTYLYYLKQIEELRQYRRHLISAARYLAVYYSGLAEQAQDDTARAYLETQALAAFCELQMLRLRRPLDFTYGSIKKHPNTDLVARARELGLDYDSEVN